MGIVQTDVFDNPETNALDLTVAVEGLLSIRVSAGSFTIAGESFELATDDLITVDVDPSNTTDVLGYLVKNNSTESVEVLVDEYVHDGVDVPFIFNRSGDYKLLAHLYSIRVPSGTTDLSSLDLRVTRITEEG